MTAYQLFDALPSHIEDALRESIRRFGVLVPVVRDQHGSTIDGHHRSRLADEMGVEYRVDVVEVADEDEAREIARTLNSDRRHLTPEQRREVVAHLRGLGHSTRAIADAVGVDAKTVRNDLHSGGDISPPAEVTGRDGKTYPAQREQPADGKPSFEERVEEMVRDELAAHEARREERREQDETLAALGFHPLTPEQKAEHRRRTQFSMTFFHAIANLATGPSAAEVLAACEPYQMYRMEHLRPALAVLNDMVALVNEEDVA